MSAILFSFIILFTSAPYPVTLNIGFQTTKPQGPPPPAALPQAQVGNGKVNVHYWPDENYTSVNLLNLDVWGADNDRVSMGVQFSVQGKKVFAPKAVSMHFVSVSNKRRFGDKAKLVAYAGEKEMKFNQSRQLPATSDGGMVLEWVEFIVPFSSFNEMTQADPVRLKVGEFDFTLSKEALESLRDVNRAVAH